MHTDILNWDHGSQETNRVFWGINKQLYERKVMGNTQMVRIAIHPKDEVQALADQKEMIQGLQDINYTFLHDGEIVKLFG